MVDRLRRQRVELPRICISLNDRIEAISIEHFEPGTKACQFLGGEQFDGSLYLLHGLHKLNPPVNRQQHAGDGACRVAGEEQDHVGELLRPHPF